MASSPLSERWDMGLAPNSAGTLAPEGGTQGRKTIRESSKKANRGYEECGLQNQPARWSPGSAMYWLMLGDRLHLAALRFPQL